MQRIMTIGFVLFIICGCISFILMPFEFRSSILPKIEDMIKECKKENAETKEEAIAEANSVREIFLTHTHRYSDKSVEFGGKK